MLELFHAAYCAHSLFRNFLTNLFSLSDAACPQYPFWLVTEVEVLVLICVLLL